MNATGGNGLDSTLKDVNKCKQHSVLREELERSGHRDWDFHGASTKGMVKRLKMNFALLNPCLFENRYFSEIMALNIFTVTPSIPIATGERMFSRLGF